MIYGLNHKILIPFKIDWAKIHKLGTEQMRLIPTMINTYYQIWNQSWHTPISNTQNRHYSNEACL